MSAPIDRPSPWQRSWPYLLLALFALTALWHAVDFPGDLDDEFPAILRPTFSSLPPPAYRLAEPGDTIDRIAIYLSSLAIILSVNGLWQFRENRGPWLSALALSIAAFWYAANPFPTFDGWHGLAWPIIFHPDAPPLLRLSLSIAALILAAVALIGLLPKPLARWNQARATGAAPLFILALLFTALRPLDIPQLQPPGYWQRWSFVLALLAFSSALVKSTPTDPKPSNRLRLSAHFALASFGWFACVTAGIWLTWYHRPLERLRVVVPGKIYMSAMPTFRGLQVAQSRRHFKTIINLFPEDTPLRSPRLPEELKFVDQEGLNYYRSPSTVTSSDDFLDLTLRVAQDPDAWPILIHCHGCMDRTPAWVGIYRFVVLGEPLDEILRFIEAHRGYRPKASVTLLYNRVLPRLAPAHCLADPTAALLKRSAQGTLDPYYKQLQAEAQRANLPASANVPSLGNRVDTTLLPSLTPRR